MDMLSLGCRWAPKELGLELNPREGALRETKHKASQKAPEKREEGSEEEKENGEIRTKPGGRDVPGITAAGQGGHSRVRRQDHFRGSSFGQVVGPAAWLRRVRRGGWS